MPAPHDHPSAASPASILPPFRGLSAFPITPMDGDEVDEAAFRRIVRRLAAADVDSIGALGSTGLAPYLTRDERRRVATAAVEEAGGTPVIVGIGALRTPSVLQHAHDAQETGAAAVLLAPVSYHKLTEDEVHELFAAVAPELSVPLCVYDNPGTTRFAFSDALLGRVAALPGVAAVKVPGPQPDDAGDRIAAIRAALPGHVALGVSGDELAAAGLSAGADAYFSVIGGVLPEQVAPIVRAARRGDAAGAAAASEALRPIWRLMRTWGSLHVTYAAAELLGLARTPSLPLPLRGLPDAPRAYLGRILDDLGAGA